MRGVAWGVWSDRANGPGGRCCVWKSRAIKWQGGGEGKEAQGWWRLASVMGRRMRGRRLWVVRRVARGLKPRGLLWRWAEGVQRLR